QVRGVVGGDDRTAPRRQLLFAGAVVGEEDAEQGLEDGQQPAADHGAEAAEARFGWRPGSASSSGRTAASSSSSARAISGAPSVEPARPSTSSRAHSSAMRRAPMLPQLPRKLWDSRSSTEALPFAALRMAVSRAGAMRRKVATISSSSVPSSSI